MLYNVLNQEVIFQEYFCNLLREKSFMKKFLDFIEQKNGILKNENIEYKNFHTEHPLILKNKTYGRADIFLDLGNKKIIFEVKNKVYTTLTDKQPQDYLNYLAAVNTDFNACLMFLIPKNYAHKEKIYQEWNPYPREEIDKQLFYWEDFVLTLKDEENVFVQAFYEFSLYWFDLNPMQLINKEKALLNFKGNSMELIKNETLASLMAKLELAVIKIGQYFQWKQDFIETGYTTGCNYTKKIKNYQLYIGIVYDMWEQYDQPINIYISDEKDFSKKFTLPQIEILEFEIYESKEDSNFDNFFAYVVKLNFKIDEENYEEKMKDIIQKIVTQLKR